MLYPLASRQISIDLDDGVKANYPKFTALKKIPRTEAADDQLSTIQGYLERRFERQRIVIWHDPAGEFESVVGDLVLEDGPLSACRTMSSIEVSAASR